MRRYIEWIIRHRFTVISITALISVLAVYQIKNLMIVIDMNATLPQSHPYVSTTNEVENIFGSKYVVIIGITPKEGDIYQPAVLEKVVRITSRLQNVPGLVTDNLLSLSARRAKNIIGSGDGLEVRPLMATAPKTRAELDALRSAVESNPVYLNAIVSNDYKTTAIIAEFKEPPAAEGFRSMLKQVESIIDNERDSTVEINVGGLPQYLSAIEKYSERMAILVPIAILVLCIVLFTAFRTRQGLMLPLVTAILAVTWGVGVMGAFGIPMDAFNATTPLLILAIATGHAVQMLKRYYEEYFRLRISTSLSPKDANNQAVIASITRVAPVMLAAGAVACIGFFSLVVFDISTVRTFGVFTGIGILAAMILEMTFIPALRSILKPPTDAEQKRGIREQAWDTLTGAIAACVTGRGRRYIYAAITVFVVLSALGINKIVVDNSVKSFFSSSTHVAKEDNILNHRLGGTNTLYLLVEGAQPDAIKHPDTLNSIDKLQNFLEKKEFVSKTISIADFIKRMNQAMHGDDASYFKIPDSQELISQYFLLYSMSGEPGDFNSYVDYDYRKGNLAVFLKTDSSAYVEALINEITVFASQNLSGDVKVRFGGSVTQSAALSEVMVRGKIMNILQIAAVVFVVSVVIFRSIVAGLLVLLPLAIAVFSNFGLMGWSGMPLNVPTAMTSAMAVGIGADYAIYLIFRLREELAAGVDEDTAVRSVIKTAGKAVLFVAIAVAAGYGVLLLSIGFNIHKWLATLIATAMLTSAFAALLLIPALVITLKPRFIYRKSPMQTHSIPAATAVLAFALILCAQPQKAFAADFDLSEIMRKNAVVTKVVDSTTEATFTLINKAGQERVRKTFGTTKLQENDVDNMRMTRFLSPSDIKGTVSLLIERSANDDDMWIYLPALKKVRRLVSSNKRDSFVGTDFSYADVIGYKPEQWGYKLLREEVIDGQACLVIEALPKDASVKAITGYSKRVDWIRKDTLVTVKSEAWDEADQKLKVLSFRDIRQVDQKRGKWQPMQLEALNVQTGHRTVIQLENFKTNQSVGSEFFTTRYMEKE